MNIAGTRNRMMRVWLLVRRKREERRRIGRRRMGAPCPKCGTRLTRKTARIVRRVGRAEEVRCLTCHAQRQQRWREGHAAGVVVVKMDPGGATGNHE